MFLYKTDILGRAHVVLQISDENMSAASLFSREQGLGILIHMKVSFISIGITYHTLLVVDSEE